MDWVRPLSGTFAPRRVIRCLLFAICLLSPTIAAAAWVAPVEGGGNFSMHVDAVNRWRDDRRLDVMVLVAVANSDLQFHEENGRLTGGVKLEVELRGPDDQVSRKKRIYRTDLAHPDDALSGTLYQVFGLVLEDVPFRYGRLVCTVSDPQQGKEGVLSRERAMSEAVADWYAEQSPRPEASVAVGDPFFMANAPLNTWNPNVAATTEEGGGFLQDYMHPARRYGLEEDHLQVFLPIWPALSATGPGDLPAGLRVQVTSQDLSIALEDTIVFDQRGLNVLRAGRPAGVVYELDVNLLPEGSYRLAIAPLDGQGRGVLSGFDVAWTLGAIGRHRDRIIGEGRTVLRDRALAEFEAASLPEKERLLDAFWAALNPDPESPVNEVYLEFQYRVAYANRLLGGFGPHGAEDPRGEVFILLGPPDEVRREVVPLNELDQEDAMVQVFNKWAPDRDGSWAKGSNPTTGRQARMPWHSQGGVPMPYSEKANRQIQLSQGSATSQFGFELWRYQQGGQPLFPNIYSADALGKRFLFVDRTGTGKYELRTTNTFQGDD